MTSYRSAGHFRGMAVAPTTQAGYAQDASDLGSTRTRVRQGSLGNESCVFSLGQNSLANETLFSEREQTRTSFGSHFIKLARRLFDVSMGVWVLRVARNHAYLLSLEKTGFR